MQNKKIVTIIGGGASGIMAAISCKIHNPDYEVVILEKNFKIGRKILATGNGRCNITNSNLKLENYHTSSKTKELIQNIFKEFNEEKIINFFNNQNLELKTEKEGRIFPRTNQALAVVKCLEYEMERLKIKIEYNFNVANIKKHDNKFIIEVYRGTPIKSDFLIIATGGLSYKDLGSTGDGYIFAKNFGHSLIKNFPSITALKLNSKILKKISGVRQEVLVKVIVDNEIIKEYFEEILFTDYGISGSAILQISRTAIENLLRNKKVFIGIQFTYESVKKEQVKKILLRQIDLSQEKKLKSVLLYFLNTILIDNLFDEVKDKLCKDLSNIEIKRIVEILTDTRFEVSGYKDWEQAQITTGGVNIDEINPTTLESKKEKGLYFCGEILDVDGDCGGYNLSWAWSSGWVVGGLI